MGNSFTCAEDNNEDTSEMEISLSSVTTFLSDDKIKFTRKLEDPPNSNVSFDDFNIVSTIGRGSYGRVLLVTKTNDENFHAMKIMDKENIVRRGAANNIVQERKILQAIDFPFTISLQFAFKSNAHLFVVLPFLPGGNLFHWLNIVYRFSEKQSSFYAAQVVLAFEYLHHVNIIYRDLKPENIVLDEHGFIKLVDFGLSKVINGRTFSFCGSPGYLAPELILGQGYSWSADWWTLGIFIYEMSTGFCPFGNSALSKWSNKTVSCKLKIPMRLSRQLGKLLRKLIEKDVTKRIGHLKDGVEEIKRHPWFKDINWEKLYQKEIPPPFEPTVAYRGSTENFKKCSYEYIKSSPENLYAAEFEDF